MAKQLLFDQEASQAMKDGIDALAEAVKVTLGPKGRNVVLDKKFGAPSLVIVGAPNFLSSTTLRPFGPSVTLTASASASMPFLREWRASSSNCSLFATKHSPKRFNGKYSCIG